MHTADTPVLKDIVLVGGGHSHAVLLKRFAMQPVPGMRLTLIGRDTHTPYSGMLPAYVAGHYTHGQVHIDLRTLAEWAGARFIQDEVIGLDRAGQRVICQGRPSVPYDLLSINIGSSPRLEVPGAAEHAVAVKPLRGFDERWLALLERVRQHTGRLRIAVVGGGAGGVELLLSMQWRLRAKLKALSRDADALEFHLFCADAQILATHNPWVRRRFESVLRERGVFIHAGQAVTEVWAGCLQTSSGRVFDADEVIWVTQAGAAPWLKSTGLALDSQGFIQVNDHLQSVSDARVFAAGDIAHMVNHPREKAGVFAVRQGRPLAENLRRAMLGLPLRPYKPQRRWLALIGTGNREAVASRGLFWAFGPWVWRWKDWIDRRFMAGFEPPMPRMASPAAPPATPFLNPEESQQALSAMAMRCGGCGAKVGANVLSRVLAQIEPIGREDVLLGLKASDDAAVLRVPPGRAVVQTVDFFRAFIDDPYLFGQIAANHALGDVYAMGGEPQSATAIVTVPPGLERKTEELLTQLLKGAVEVLNAAGCALVGGHTGEGRELALGFAVNGLVDESLQGLMTKGGMKPGQCLILTKPLGTGTLLVAHQQLRAQGRWMDAALASMRQSSQEAGRCLQRHGATACTDLTGFGLLGHLVEMTRPSGVDVELDVRALPVLEGAVESAAAGFLSSLQPANLRLRAALRNPQAALAHAYFPLLFDPQTAGGLLASVPAEQATECLAELKALGYSQAAVIGRVMPQSAAGEPIVLKC